MARYYASGQGRFTSADSFQGFTRNPQTLNLYAYVQNNPLNFADPSGHRAAVPDMWVPTGADDYNYIHALMMYHVLGIEPPSPGVESVEGGKEDAGTASSNVVNDKPSITWDSAELMSEEEVLRSAPFEGTPYKNTAELTVDHSRAGNVNEGDAFTIRVRFTLPKYAKGISPGPTSFVKLPEENRFKFYTPQGQENPYSFHAEKRSASVIIHLQQRDPEAKNSYVTISVRGTYGDGSEFHGQGKVRLVSKADLPRQKMPKIP